MSMHICACACMYHSYFLWRILNTFLRIVPSFFGVQVIWLRNLEMFHCQSCVHVFTCCACMHTLARAETFSINWGDHHRGMLKVNISYTHQNSIKYKIYWENKFLRDRLNLSKTDPQLSWACLCLQYPGGLNVMHQYPVVTNRTRS